MASLQTIKNWFKTGLRPTEQQFSDTWDSFFHKSDKIPIAQVEGIDGVFNAVNGAVTNVNNLANELNKRHPATPFKFIQKGFGNTDLAINQVGDIFCGWSNDGTIRISEAIYNGGLLTDSNNFTPLAQTSLT